MRGLALTALAIALLSAAPTRAQTYDPGFPVCIQTYGISGNYIGCSFTSIDQCRASASGRAAQCIVNPYYAVTPRQRTGRGY
jgi:hypothetical protein